jgi:hypothetical protein
MEQIFNEIWVYVVSSLGGLSLTAILTSIVYGCLKGAFSKTISKLNVEKIAEEATEKGIDRVKKVSFTHSIQPIVESELKKINEYSTEIIKKELADTQKKYDSVITILEKFALYFDNSIGVTEETKKELKQAIATAKNKPISIESVVVEETTEEMPKQAVNSLKEPKNTTNVQR